MVSLNQINARSMCGSAFCVLCLFYSFSFYTNHVILVIALRGTQLLQSSFPMYRAVN